jgi:ribosome-associated toxin RatA of RatAB toxin-antitoxin module
MDYFKQMNYINKSEEINVDHELIFTLINNVGEYHKFLPWCSDSKIISDINSKMSAEIEISKNFISWKFSTDNYNTTVELYLEYKFDSRIIELSIKPIFSKIMSSILDSFISEAFKRKGAA